MINKKGFTLVEVLAVVALISIIAVAASTSVIGMRKRVQKEECNGTIRNIIETAKMYCNDGYCDVNNKPSLQEMVHLNYINNNETDHIYINNSTGKIYLDSITINMKKENERWNVDKDTEGAALGTTDLYAKCN